MVSLSLNSIKQIMKTMVDTHGFDRVLSKVSRHHLVFEEMLAECITLAVCGVVQKLRVPYCVSEGYVSRGAHSPVPA